MRSLSFYEFFCGGGGAQAGLGEDWQCLLANDIDQAKMRSYILNWGAQGAVTRDVADLTTADLPDAASLGWGSFPCQDLSAAGDKAGVDGIRSNALWPCLSLMDALRPEGRPLPMIVLENVEGLLKAAGASFLDMICNTLTTMGYRYGVLQIDAAMFLPQSRKRVFIVAADAALPIPATLTMPSPAMPFHTPPIVAAMRRQKAAPIWWRLPTTPVRSMVLADLIEDEPSGPFPQEGLWHHPAETDRLIAMMTPVNVAKIEKAKRAGKRMVGGLYKRRRDEPGGRIQRAEVRFDGVAGCLRLASAGGSNVQNVMIVDGPSVRSRRLSVREAARLMGFEDSYKLPDNYVEAYDLMADGLAIPVVRHLDEHVLEPVLQASGVGLGLAAE